MRLPKVLKILFLIIAIGFIVFIILSMTFLYFFTKDMCSSVEVQRLISPDRKKDAVVIEADCGATTSVTQQLYIGKHNEQSTEKMVAFFDGAVINNNETNLSKYGIIVKWKTPSKLVIQYSDVKHVGMDHSVIEFNDEKIHLELNEGK